MKPLLSKPLHSVMTRLAVIVAAMGLMIGAAVYVSWSVFQSIEAEMLTMSENKLPQLRAGAAVGIATDETRAFLSGALSATSEDQLVSLQARQADLITGFRTTLLSLPEDVRLDVTALLDDAEPALQALLAARRDEMRATSDALAALDTAFRTANVVSARLEEATDSALFEMTLSGEDAILSIDETLTALVDRDFAQFQIVLAIQSEVNLLSGLGLAIQAGSGSDTRTITDDLAVSSLNRLETTLGLAEGIDALSDVSGVVAGTLDFYKSTFSGAGRVPSPSEILAMRLEVDNVLSPAVDDAYFNLVIGSEAAKDASTTALTNLMETEVATMRNMSALDAATKSFFSLALKVALSQTATEVALAQGELLSQEVIVRSLKPNLSDAEVLTEVENLLSLADAGEGIAAKQNAVFMAQSAAADASAAAAQAVGEIATATASFSAQSIDSIDENAAVLRARVDAAGVQISQIGVIGLLSVLIAPLFVWALVTRPLNRVTAVTERLADGDLSEITTLKQNNGELGRLASALHVFRANALLTIEMREQEKQRDKEARDSEKAAEDAKRRAAEAEKKRQQDQEEHAQQQAEAARREMLSKLGTSIGAVVAAASKGDFSHRVDVTFDDAELAQLASSVNTLLDSVASGLRETTATLSRVADGDLSEGLSGEFHGDFARLQDGTNGMIEALRALVTDISGSGNNLAASSAELRDTSDGLSRQAEQNAASLEETSAALEELSASIKQVSGSAAEANENASVASATARSSGEVAADAAASMARISEASNEITQAVGVINDIAFQINLLALNAGVEAARAGDAGRGFSVVASEVRQLAQRASEAAKEIDAVIARSDEAVSEGVAKVGNAQTSLASISESVVNITGRVEDISRAISEQVHGIGEITNAVSLIDQNTQKQAASFEEVTAAGSLLANEAEGLRKSTARFTVTHETERVKRASVEEPTSLMREPELPHTAVAVVGAAALASGGWDEF